MDKVSQNKFNLQKILLKYINFQNIISNTIPMRKK